MRLNFPQHKLFDKFKIPKSIKNVSHLHLSLGIHVK